MDSADTQTSGDTLAMRLGMLPARRGAQVPTQGHRHLPLSCAATLIAAGVAFAIRRQ